MAYLPETPRLLSLFSGLGAFESALENIGVSYDLIAYSEIDKAASKAYALLHGVPEGLNLGDITKINEAELAELMIDLIVYGFPCQDISIAGAKKGLTDENGAKTRSGLYFDALRIIGATQPRVAIAENVKHLTSETMKPVFDTVLKGLEDAGYNNYWRVLNTADHELPQDRKRVIIVSIRKDIDDGRFEFPEPVPLRTCMGDFLDEVVPENYYLSDDKLKNVLTHNAAHAGQLCDKGGAVHDAPCKRLQGSKGGEMLRIIQAADLRYYGNDQMNRVYSPVGLAPTLKTVSGGAEK